MPSGDDAIIFFPSGLNQTEVTLRDGRLVATLPVWVSHMSTDPSGDGVTDLFVPGMTWAGAVAPLFVGCLFGASWFRRSQNWVVPS